ncbi:hypothetical protein GCM10025858_01930 [Alicyclobacillus sacchari]|nr:hypothetical protein GCM10025858_01930 [Alicyclobacillus sacchari]
MYAQATPGDNAADKGEALQQRRMDGCGLGTADVQFERSSQGRSYEPAVDVEYVVNQSD